MIKPIVIDKIINIGIQKDVYLRIKKQINNVVYHLQINYIYIYFFLSTHNMIQTN